MLANSTNMSMKRLKIMHYFQLLNWDTEKLGIKTAKILPTRLDSPVLLEQLAQLKEQGVKLVYWASESTDAASQQAAEQARGVLVDYKLTYYCNLETLDPAQLHNNGIESYDQQFPDQQLEKLAIEIGKYSRFGQDPHLTSSQMEAIYKAWLLNSTKRIVANAVLVVKDKEKIIGMVTLTEKDKRGDISLIAVDPDYRGQQLGKRLVHAAQLAFMQAGYTISQVVTQQTNTAACHLYESCGYRPEKLEHFYHFWL